jgi:hypothetical protein
VSRPTTSRAIRQARWLPTGVLRQVLLIALAMGAYLLVRTLTEGATSVAEQNARDVLHVERAIGLDWEAGAQALILEQSSLVRFFNFVYTWMFWPVLAVALIVLYRRDRRDYARFRNALFISGAVGLVVFAMFPVAPPRFLDGFTDTINAFSGQSALAHPSGVTNEYAAMPSFHVGWTVLAGVALWRVLRRWVLRSLAIVPGLLMSLTVVVTANHYVLDAAAGVIVAFGGFGLALLGDRLFARPAGAEAPRRARRTLAGVLAIPLSGAPSSRAQLAPQPVRFDRPDEGGHPGDGDPRAVVRPRCR